MKRWMMVLALAALVGAAGCGDSSDDGGGSSGGLIGGGGSGAGMGSGIGPFGGQVVHESGLTVTVPAGALSGNVAVSVGVLDRATMPAVSEGFDYITDVYELLPSGQTFAAPVDVAIPLGVLSDASAVPEIRVVTLENNAWVDVAAVRDQGAMKFSVSTFGVFSVIGGATPEPEPEIPWPDCEYPEGPAEPDFGEVFPNLSWRVAYKADGGLTTFSMREVFCSEEYADVETIVFIASSIWCPNCPDYMQYIADLSDAFAEANSLIIWLEVQDRDYNRASSAEAVEHVNRIVGNAPGIRVGDEDTLPAPAFDRNFLVQAFPSQFVVRKRDMKVIVASSNSDFITPVLQVARHPEADWNNPGDNVLPTNVGEACETDADCETGTLISYCIPASDGWSRGYCIALGCNSDAACGDSGQICAPGDNLDVCYQGCTSDNEEEVCRSGYSCSRVAGITGPRGCAP